MKDYNYKILNPGGNKTALVYGTDFTKAEKAKINNEILDVNSDVEQVGFLSKTQNRLEMAGGEFCANATRCAIYEILNKEQGEIQITVSGYNAPIVGGVNKDGIVYTYLQIDKEKNDLIQKIILKNINCYLVKLDGIWQVIMNERDSKKYINMLKTNENKAKKILKELMSSIITKEKAIGIMLIEKEKKDIKINPVVWVKTVDTLYYETACGSGSLAYAIYNYTQNGGKNVDLIQPSGYKISVNIFGNKKTIQSVKISGIVI